MSLDYDTFYYGKKSPLGDKSRNLKHTYIHTYMSYAQLSLLERRIASCCLPVFDAGVLINLGIYQ